MKRSLLDRRRFLSTVGAGAVSLPWLRSLPSYAQTDDKRYLILLFTPNGCVRHLWGADPGAAPGELVLRKWLEPLEPFKDRISIVKGLANKCAGIGDPHGPGMATLWTGIPTANQQIGQGPSIDQVIAEALKPPTPHSTLEFRAKSPQDYASKDIYTRMIYAGAGDPRDPRENALETRDALFLGIDPMESAAPDPRLEVRSRLLTHLDGELVRMTPKLCTEDRVQLEALRDAWHVLGDRLESSGTGALASCEYPSAVAGETAFPKTTRDIIELLVMSLACDLTRVSSLQFSHALSPMVPDWLGLDMDHHNISHEAPHRFELGPEAPAKSDAENPLPAQLENRPAIDKLTSINVFYAEEIAYLCERLDQFPVGGGKTLLDQSILCWGNELDNGSDHDHWSLPFVLIGGAGGRLKTGQIFEAPEYNGYSKQPGEISGAARAHNDLHTTLAALMGADEIGSFGEAAFNQGPIEELIAT